MNLGNYLGYTIFAALAIWVIFATIRDKFPRRKALTVILLVMGGTMATYMVSL